jgi:hypothetical protein
MRVATMRLTCFCRPRIRPIRSSNPDAPAVPFIGRYWSRAVNAPFRVCGCLGRCVPRALNQTVEGGQGHALSGIKRTFSDQHMLVSMRQQYERGRWMRRDSEH